MVLNIAQACESRRTLLDVFLCDLQRHVLLANRRNMIQRAARGSEYLSDIVEHT